MKRKVKVFQLQNSYNVNSSDLAEQIILGLPEEHFEVTTAFLRGRPGPDEPVSRAKRSVYFDLTQSKTKGLRLSALWALYKHCRNERYDAVVVHRVKPINMMMILNRWLRIPACIGVLHGIGEYDRTYRKYALKCLINRSWRLVGVSRAVYNDLLNCGAGLNSGSARQINNAIDIKKTEALLLPRLHARASLGLPSDSVIFGTIGRLVPVKGHTDLLEAFAKISEQHPNALIAIIGEGRSRNDLQATIQRLGISERAILLGAKPDALRFVRAFDCFVMPSHSEGLPLALLEGMSAHLPVIGSNISSLKPILEDCGGRMFSVGQADELAERLKEVLALSHEERLAEGNRTYTYLCRTHAIEDFRRKYRELFDELLEQAG